MRVVYRSRKSHSKLIEPGREPVLELSWDNWDDFGYKTTLKATLCTQSGARQLDNLKILVKDSVFTAS
jgi:hypothetical protein